MPPPSVIPANLLGRPFTTTEARAAGVSHNVLRGRRFKRLFHGVWVCSDHPMTELDWIQAAGLAMPSQAKLSHMTRIRHLGLELGDPRPFHFTVQGDLHLTVPNIFLHRTELMPPTDDVGVTPASAFLGLCSTARVMDAIIVGDWLLHNGNMTLIELRELAERDRWRPGAEAALWVTRHLSERSRSPKESELRALFAFSGLPELGVNVPLADGPDSPIGDLLWRTWMVVLEFEGKHHFHDAEQIRRDIGRYAWMRTHGYAYLQVTNDMLSQPRALVVSGHRLLVGHGYDGPGPSFDSRWRSLFDSCSRTAARARIPHPGGISSTSDRRR